MSQAVAVDEFFDRRLVRAVVARRPERMGLVERAVVEEQEKIRDTHEFATAERAKRVAVTAAEQEAQEALVKEIKKAEAGRDATRFTAEQQVISADALRDAAERETAAKKMLAEGVAAEEAALGVAEANVIEKKAIAEARGMEAKADAVEKHGTAEATVLERKAVAEAKGMEAKAQAIEKTGTAEATVIEQKEVAHATGITEKAKAMKIFNEAGKEHEEFKLRLHKEKDVELAAILAQQEIAQQQAGIVGKALESDPDGYRALLDDPLFEVASHTYSHKNLGDNPFCGPVVPLPELREDILRGKEVVESVFGRPCAGLRPGCGLAAGLRGAPEASEASSWSPTSASPAPSPSAAPAAASRMSAPETG